MDDARRAGRVDEPLHRRRHIFRAGNVELPRWLHEVHLRVDVPEDAAGHTWHLAYRPAQPRRVAATRRGRRGQEVRFRHLAAPSAERHPRLMSDSLRDTAPGVHHITVGATGPIEYYKDHIDRLD